MARDLLTGPVEHSIDPYTWAASDTAEAVRALTRLAQARDILNVLANAQRGLVCESDAGSVTLDYGGAPTAEAAILEAAERLVGSGGLRLVRRVSAIQLELAAEFVSPSPEGSQPLDSEMLSS